MNEPMSNEEKTQILKDLVSEFRKIKAMKEKNE